MVGILLSQHKKVRSTKTENNIEEVTGEPMPRVVGGKATDPDRFPYFVALVGSSGSVACGGSLIAQDVVLTAAHCSV